ncbi:chitin synthase-domain-containing protein [Fimicolochytrium jonesii]|uniref:chitin synthase-domain-containing protein n=1 Tax=Fimicolochytrium jonesii TaxID=1396493 RepID=UPI0022FE397B|nr:chitin synthase-domain-containing protein [Fimicolochytrium jonesii]KAI8825096.1 chitin synthase-domain-containing protein [Fimicolochytrium jonesii]
MDRYSSHLQASDSEYSNPRASYASATLEDDHDSVANTLNNEPYHLQRPYVHSTAPGLQYTPSDAFIDNASIDHTITPAETTPPRPYGALPDYGRLHADGQGSSSIRRRVGTVVNRRTKTIKLSSQGNFVVKQKVPQEIRSKGAYEKGEEFESLRYTAATVDPDEFVDRGYNLRASNYARQIEIAVVVTMYNEDEEGFNRTMFALAENIRYLCRKEKNGWDADGWQKVAIVIVSDGRSKIHPNVLKVLEVMGVYQEGLTQAAVSGHETTAHIFEYSPQTFLDPKMQLWGAREGMPPMQTIFCLKEKNAKKINSHRWFFRAFCNILNPRVCVMIDVGTRPTPNSLYSLWKTFSRNPQIAGACGEIRSDMGEGLPYFKNLVNPLVASQNFEYKISNILDKSLESAFGYITVLPGAFSAYRWTALQDIGPGSGPLSKYFEGEARNGVVADSSIFSANLYLAEDRILCFELVAKKGSNWVLHYDSRAKADTDVPNTIPEFLSQRRRWLNGSLFAGFYALMNLPRVWGSKHSLFRKLGFTMQWMYNVVNQLFSWFILGNFAITFFFLFSELEQILASPDPTTDSSAEVRNKIVSVVINIARFSYPVVLVCLFIISFGNRPQAFRLTYKAVMLGFGVIGATMISLLVRRFVMTLHFFQRMPTINYTEMMKPVVNPSTLTTNDGSQMLVNTLLAQMSRVVTKELDKELARARWENLVYCVTLGSTIGVYFLASFMHLDFAHMFTSFVQYLLLLPSYINVLTVFALSNLHDISWGTKGDTRPTALPAVTTSKSAEGVTMATVQISTSQQELSDHYGETLAELRTFQHQDPSQKGPKTALDQEDSYKSFRTTMMLLYLGTNAVLFAVGTTQVTGEGYLNVLLAATAGLSVVKLMGSVYFIVAKNIAKLRWKVKERKFAHGVDKMTPMASVIVDRPYGH